MDKWGQPEPMLSSLPPLLRNHLARCSRKKVTNKCQLGSTSQSRGWGERRQQFHPFTNAVCKCGAIIVSHGSLGCRFWLCSPTTRYHGDVAAPFVKWSTPRLAPSKRILWQINLLRACRVRLLIRGSHVHGRVRHLCFAFFLCPSMLHLHMLANLEEKKGRGEGSMGTERGSPRLVCCVTCLSF